MIVSIRKPLKKQYTDKTYIVFYVEGPILRYCDFSKINSDNDIYKYFEEKTSKTLILQGLVAFPAYMNGNKKVNTNKLISELSKRHKGCSILRSNSKSELEYQEWESLGNELYNVNIPDKILLNMISPACMFNWKKVIGIRDSIPGAVRINYINYMRRLWILKRGLIDKSKELNRKDNSLPLFSL